MRLRYNSESFISTATLHAIVSIIRPALIRGCNADTILFFFLLCCGALAACSRSDNSTSSAVMPAGDWAKVGETDSYAYYADHASIRKADETVTMSDLFDYKTAQVDGGGPPALPKRTGREYDCQGQKSQPLKSSWFSGKMGAGSVVRSATGTTQWAAAPLGTATAGLLKIACGNP
ncbi:MAG: surface-adhesin E family protein [Nitrospirales bacterium]